LTGLRAPPASEAPEVRLRPTLRERWERKPPGLGLLVGAGILAVYLVAGLSALIVFRGSLSLVSANPGWVNPNTILGPSWDHPFGVLPGLGVDLFLAIWQATPWDLGIVGGILTIDVTVGFLIGAVAGYNDGGLVDSIATFLIDSLGSIPTFFFVIIVFAGLATVAPRQVGLPVFVGIFGLVLWPTMARTVRDRARSVAHEPFVESSRASGASSEHILLRHILPNSLGPVLAQIPLDIAPIFFVLAAFPWYFNCAAPGPPPGNLPGGPPVPYLIPALPPFSPLPSPLFPEWGFLLGVGTCEGLGFPGQTVYWWMFLFPLLAILVFALAVAFVCDGIERWRRIDR
jgi:ABC-type dipeptide/oligopeptide/nickel transport system permease subunit